MTTMPKAEVTLPSDSTVKVVRSFKAPRHLVYEAYTTPALMQRWLTGYPGWTMHVCDMDVRVGGKFRWGWRSEEGQEFGFFGEFREVSPPARLVHTEFFDPGSLGGDMGEGSLITVELTERDGVTTVATVMDFGSKQSRDAAMSTGMTDGMEASYQVLDGVLDELAA